MFTFPTTLFSYSAPAPATLLDWDFRTPNVQSFSASATGVIPGRTADEIWLFDEASGNLVGEVASSTLVVNGSPSFQRSAVGFWNGTDMWSKKSIQYPSASDYHASASATAFQYGSATSFAFIGCARGSQQGTLQHIDIFGNQDLTGPQAGYKLILRNNGVVRWDIRDSDYAASSIQTVGTDFAQGQWFAFLAVVDRNANATYLYTTTENVVSGTPPSGNTDSSSDYFHVGKVGGGSNYPFEIAYLASFSGAAAEGLTQSDLDNWWTCVNEPNGGTLVRNSMVFAEVGYEAGFGLRCAHLWKDEMAYQWSTNFTHASKLGLCAPRTGINRANYSQDMAQYTMTSVSGTSHSEPCPTGAQYGSLLVATANNGYAQSTNCTTTQGVRATVSTYIKRGDGESSDVTGRIIMWDVTGAAEEASYAFTATAEWDRIWITVDSSASYSQAIRIEIDTSGESVCVWGGTHNMGGLSTAIPTLNTSYSTAITQLTFVNTDGNTVLQSAQGEVRMDMAALSDNDRGLENERQLFAAGNATNNNDLISLWINNAADANTLQGRIYDSSATLRQTVSAADPGDWAAEHEIRFRWDSAAGVDGNSENADILLDAARAAGSATTWTAGTNATTLTAANDRVQGTTNAGATIARIRIFGAPQAA